MDNLTAKTWKYWAVDYEYRITDDKTLEFRGLNGLRRFCGLASFKCVHTTEFYDSDGYLRPDAIIVLQQKKCEPGHDFPAFLTVADAMGYHWEKGQSKIGYMFGWDPEAWIRSIFEETREVYWYNRSDDALYQSFCIPEDRCGITPAGTHCSCCRKRVPHQLGATINDKAWHEGREDGQCSECVKLSRYEQMEVAMRNTGWRYPGGRMFFHPETRKWMGLAGGELCHVEIVLERHIAIPSRELWARVYAVRPT